MKMAVVRRLLEVAQLVYYDHFKTPLRVKHKIEIKTHDTRGWHHTAPTRLHNLVAHNRKWRLIHAWKPIGKIAIDKRFELFRIPRIDYLHGLLRCEPARRAHYKLTIF